MLNTEATIAVQPTALINNRTLEDVNAQLRKCRRQRTYWLKNAGEFTEPEDVATLASLMKTLDNLEWNLLDLRRLLTTPCPGCGKVPCKEVAA